MINSEGDRGMGQVISSETNECIRHMIKRDGEVIMEGDGTDDKSK